jgi:hypothetical protein
MLARLRAIFKRVQGGDASNRPQGGLSSGTAAGLKS